MIFALFGTNPYPFKRLADWLDRLAREEGHDILAQTGTTPPLAHCRSFNFASYASIRANMEAADCIVAQGGYGSCIDALYLGRPLIIVPRHPEMSESRDKQEELGRYLAAHSDAILADSYETLRDSLETLSANTARSRTSPGAYGAAVGGAILAFLGRDRT